MTTDTATPQVAPKVKRSRTWLVTIVVVLVVAGLCVAGLVLRDRLSSDAADYSGLGSGKAVIEVKAGDTASDIGSTLTQAGVVASTTAFVDAAIADQRSLGIQPGFYELQEKMAAQAALSLLLDPGARVELSVTVPEGLRLDQVLQTLAQETELPLAQFEALVDAPTKLSLPDYADGEAEGFLFPATYSFAPDVTAQQVLRTMVDRYDQASHDLRLEQQAATLGYSAYEVLTIASLVQAEVAERDFGKAARVVYNRLNAGMPLQFDSTVNYALNSDDITLENEQLDVDSPYNTYRVSGLPPGPINSPGEAALRAALNPPAGDWIYFIAVSPESDASRFTASYDQFLQWKDEFYAQTP